MNADLGCSTGMTLQSCKPVLCIDDVKTLLCQRYGIETADVKEFESYDDRTYYVKTKLGCGIGEGSEFIAKVLNSQNTALQGVVATHTDVMNHLKSFPELCCQFALPNLDGDLLSYEIIPNDMRDGDRLIGREEGLSALRLFDFMPGKPLNTFSPLSPRFCFEAGVHLGKLQQALQEYPGDTKPLKLKASVWQWNVSLLPRLRNLLPLVVDIQKRRLVEEVIDKFEATVVPSMADLRQGILYNDFNGDNVLVIAAAAETGDCSGTNCLMTNSIVRISGVIDFDDILHAYLVYEIAIGMMYMMFCSDEPVAAAAYMLTGFETVSPLPHNERQLLRVLVGSRLAQSLLISTLQTKNHPDNKYVASSLIKGWSLLEEWWGRTEAQLQELWDSVRVRCTGQL
ncbi:hydroxylysine kinase-like [Acanthaster planci]|uniref:Hydroxylysine kinase n=1 Tax=Acanthaster planci TaxID=133434 RepID=A0A8B7XU25_ACAPL|nr:hydroxylysine kinase-like [Acanthaster planci]XP_022083745.1 hydroxylysine kinase-like [Acanthaster planci]